MTEDGIAGALTGLLLGAGFMWVFIRALSSTLCLP